ncbi:Athe_2463 domain-containing protein, partial [Caldisalinibacter kiritimatiensis]|uniref:Athe_2463 domain-containing protein n=1 Tax=Caldisalinibacter kiritimatiensis TaxID=1304284 RepID=UPI0005519F2A
DVKRIEGENDERDGEYRYLGYNSVGELYTNSLFPPDGATKVSDPHNWNFQIVDEEKVSWGNLKPYQINHMYSVALTGNRIEELYDPFYLNDIKGGDKRYIRVISPPTIKSKGSIFVQFLHPT